MKKKYAEDALKRRLVALNDDERAQTFEKLRSDRNHQHRCAMRKLDEEEGRSLSTTRGVLKKL